MRSVLFPIGRHEDWGKWVTRAESLAEEIGDNIRLANALNHVSNLHWMHGAHRKAMEVAKRALSLAEVAGDFSVQIACMYHLGLYCFNLGEYQEQVGFGQRVRALVRQETALQAPGLAGLPGAISNSVLAVAISELGNFEEIDEIAREVLDKVGKGGNLFTRSAASNFLAMAYLRFKDIKRALQLLEDSYKNCQQYKMKAPYSFTITILGHAHLLSNEVARAQTLLEEAIEHEGFQEWLRTYLLTILAETYCALGNMDRAEDAIGRALETAGVREERGMEAWAMLVHAGIHAEEGRLEEAVKCCHEGMTQASGLAMRPLVAHFQKALGPVYRRLGREEEGQKAIETAREMYRSMGMRYWLDS